MNGLPIHLRPISVAAARWRGTGLPRLSEALRSYYQRRWQGGEVIIDRFQGNLRIAVDPAEHMGSRIFWFDAYSKAELELIQALLKPGQGFIDVGANIGEFTLVAARAVGTFGRIIAFEPVADIRARLKHNISLNRFSWVSVREEALGDCPGTIELFSGDYHGEVHAGLPTAFKSDERAARVGTAQQATLDSILAELDLPSLAGIKLDIEGGELFALRGAQRCIDRFKPWIICEIGKETCAAAGYEPGDVLEFLLQRGYSVSSIRENCRLDKLRDANDLDEWQNVLARQPG